MEQRTLGSSGLSVDILGLGTMTFGDEADEPTSHQILDRYLEAGGTFIDTADDSPFFAWSINRDTEAVLKQSPFERPTVKRPKRSPKPPFHVASKDALGELQAEPPPADRRSDGRS